MKFVFILNSLQNQRCIKRVEEFIANGFDVDVYAFSRKIDMNNSQLAFKYEVVGEFENGSSMKTRLPIMMKAYKNILAKYKGKDVIYYLFKIDNTLMFNMLNRKAKYIYEESDLTHTYFSNSILKKLVEKLDVLTIKRSFCTVLTSEGFVKYHFGNTCPQNVKVIPNRLSVKIKSVAPKAKKAFDPNKIKIGFVGYPRFNSVLSFINIFCKNYPQHEFHVFGGPVSDEFKQLDKRFSNCYVHGPFINPDDLPDIYSNLDLVLSTYDVQFENVRYAEPNKIYEAIYFETPIIVSKGTFLEEKVDKLGIGYGIDPLSEAAVCNFINDISAETLNEKTLHAASIPKEEAINFNKDFFTYLSDKIREYGK